ncbi:MAG TPA: ATP-binding cassette domain-containing protein [Longimicrobiales bacterium]|nr:ATP-binding cassette domain-containing protein [Longimicrobiales bacterium]
MALLSCQNLRIAFGGRPLLDDASLQIERGERIGLVGRNGEGKSTLLKILEGDVLPDGGDVVGDSGVRVGLLTQEVPEGLRDTRATAEEVIAAGVSGHQDPHHTVQRLCSLLQLEADHPFADLSGGQKRRVLLGRALAAEPDLLLLDEPTNHLDLESIEWLEGFLLRWTGTLLFVTHDRAFLQRLATRIVELDRGRLTSWACDYPTYLRRKDDLLAAEEREWTLQDKKLAAEEVWIRQGIKARRTRNEGRVRALKALRADRAQRRERVGQVKLTIQQAERSGAKVITARHVDFAWGKQAILKDFSTSLLRGDKVGIIGPNGCGKTTLLGVLLGKLQPDAGTVTHGVALKVSYFDQHRVQLDEARTVADSVGHGGDHVTIDGERRHVFAYLEDFLFSPERARQPVSALSGGERNRLLLARLFTQPANVLVLDEPTNDLDAETLELLEARLMDFGGTVLVVSHDRRFLDDLCTSTLVFEGEGRVKEYVGGYSDWKRTVQSRPDAERPPAKKPRVAPSVPVASVGPSPAGPKKLTWAEKKEWESLPGRIEALEAELRDLHARMGDAGFYRGAADAIREVTERSQELPPEIEAAYARWAELDERA